MTLLDKFALYSAYVTSGICASFILLTAFVTVFKGRTLTKIRMNQLRKFADKAAAPLTMQTEEKESLP